MYVHRLILDASYVQLQGPRKNLLGFLAQRLKQREASGAGTPVPDASTSVTGSRELQRSSIKEEASTPSGAGSLASDGSEASEELVERHASPARMGQTAAESRGGAQPIATGAGAAARGGLSTWLTRITGAYSTAGDTSLQPRSHLRLHDSSRKHACSCKHPNT